VPWAASAHLGTGSDGRFPDAPWLVGQTGSVGSWLNRPLRTRRTAELKAWARNQPVAYESRAFVRARRRANTWVSWNARLGGGPRLVVRGSAIEVSAPQGKMLEFRTIVFRAADATMRRDRVGWAGGPIGRKDCIHIHVPRGRSWVDLAVSPADGIEEARDALCHAGVQPTT
jgi:hypothetical protein